MRRRFWTLPPPLPLPLSAHRPARFADPVGDGGTVVSVTSSASAVSEDVNKNKIKNNVCMEKTR